MAISVGSWRNKCSDNYVSLHIFRKRKVRFTFKTGGVDGCDCEEVLRLIEQGRIDTTPLITHRFPLSEIEEAYRIFENKLDGVIKVAIVNE